MKKRGRVVGPGYNKETLPVGQQKKSLVENPTRCFVELNRNIGKLHHSFCGDQYDYMIPYYKTNFTGTLKAKYTAKVVGEILLISLLAAGVLILPYIFHTYLKMNLIVPCAVVLVLLLYLNLPRVVRLFANMRGKSEKDPQQSTVQWRILSQKEVEQLKQKITEGFQVLLTSCAGSKAGGKESWLQFRERILEIQRKQMLYSAQSMHDIRSTDLLCYRFLSLFLPLYKASLSGVALLLYTYILRYLLITGIHSLPVYRLKNIMDFLLFAGVISFFICLIQLIITSQSLKNFKQQLAFFHESAQETEKRIKVLVKRHEVQ